MKKFAYIFTIALMGMACSKENVAVESPVDETPAGKVEYRITVSIDPETRATMNEKKLRFAANDEIAVIGTKNNVAEVVALKVETVSSTTVTFVTTIDDDMTIGEYAYYPKSIVNENAPMTINWPSAFDGTKVEIPMMAKINVSENKAVFRHLGAALKVTLVDAPAGVNTLEFKTTNNFVGSYNVTFSGDAVSAISASSLSGNTETLTVNSSATTYYIPIPAGISAGDISYADFQLAMKQGSYYHKQKTANLGGVTITPVIGNMVNLGNFKYDVDQIAEWWFKNPTNGWNSGYNRFIKTGANTYHITVYNASDYHWSLVKGSDVTTWNVKDDATAWSGVLTDQNWTFYRTGGDDKTFWITLTDNNGTWSYNSGNWDTNSDRNYSSSDVSVFFSTSIDLDNDGTDDWDNVQMTKYNYNENYSYKYEGLVVPDNSEFKFKFKVNGSDWEWWIGGSSVNLSDAIPYAQAVASGGDDMRFVLTPGTYNVYLDMAILNFMFVKQ